ncbi:MAG: C4-dicarboxylate TRAP transporter substrate-binding protein [Roseibium sp.]
MIASGLFGRLNRLSLSVALAAGLAAFSAGSATAQEKLVVSLDTGATHLQSRLVRQFVETLEERSGGALTGEVFDSAQLYNSRDAGKAVARGDVAMSILTTPALSRIEANLNVFDLPMLNGLSIEQRNALVDGELGRQLSQMVGERMGVVVPGKWLLLGRVLYWSTTKPLASLEDFKGLQVRIPGGAANVARLEALGATAVVMPFADTPLALQQGVVDATMGSKETMVAQKLVDTGIRHAFWDRGIVGYRMPIVSRQYWGSLNDDQKTLFTEAWNEIVAIEREDALKGEVSDQKTLEAQGVTFSEANQAEAAKAREILMPIQPGLIEKLGISAEIVSLAEAGIK